MAHYTREEIMSSSEVVRNFGAVLSSVVQHRREKIAIVRNNRLEAVLVAADVYERLVKSSEIAPAAVDTTTTASTVGNSAAVLDFLQNSRLAGARLSAAEIDQQVSAEREAWEK
jgi:PHD/YefM family antitoxin component YafN of YafNO toxin-antitoxin module